MTIFLSIVGIVGSFFLIKYREFIGDTMGEADWMHIVGGVYNLVIIIAIFIFFWSIAAITGTQEILLSPLLYLFPHSSPPPSPSGF